MKRLTTSIIICIILLSLSIYSSIQSYAFIKHECQYYGLSKTCTIQHLGMHPQMYTEWPWGFLLIDSNDHQRYFSSALKQGGDHEIWEREIKRYYICDSCWILEETDCSHSNMSYRTYRREGASLVEATSDSFPVSYIQQIQRIVPVNLDMYYQMTHQKFSANMAISLETTTCILLLIILLILIRNEKKRIGCPDE